MGTAHPVSSFPLTFPIRWNSNLIFSQPSTTIRSRRRAQRLRVTASSSSSSSNSTRLVTFLGKGGSGKTTSAILAALVQLYNIEEISVDQVDVIEDKPDPLSKDVTEREHAEQEDMQHNLYYANSGLNTCLVIQSQDPSAEYLMGCKIGTSPTVFNNNLSAVRLETTKMILEPLNQLKQADARLKLTQGVLEGVVGEELGVLPGMDSIFTALALSKMMGLLGTAVAKTRQPLKRFDVVIYDGISNEETLRMIGMAERARWYLKYLRNMAEKIDIGRLTAPSLLRLVEEATSLNVGGLRFNGKMSSEIWDELERILEKTSAVFSDPSKFGCYVVLNPESLTSVNSALRYWGCTIQSGAQVSGAFGFIPKARAESAENIKKRIAPLPFAFMPYLSMDSPIDMDASLLREDAQNLLSAAASSSKFHAAVNFDQAKKSVTLFMPGFDKSEIKLYQYRGGSELLVEAGDQRRVIRLPPGIQGKVGGAKFTEKSLVITMR